MKKSMFSVLIIAFAVGGSMVLGVASCGKGKSADIAAIQKTDEEVKPEDLIPRGAYLVSVMGCHDCHSPKIMTNRGPALDTSRLLSGHPASLPLAKFDKPTTQDWVLFNMTTTAMVGPWGASYSANLTSDQTGIGTWTLEQFKKALKEGKSKGLEGSRPLLPPMPWENYKNIADKDVEAIFAYLKSTKPVDNVVPKPLTPDQLADYYR